LYAIRWVIDYYKSQRETATNQTLIDSYDKIIPPFSYLLTHLARDWHHIEPGDKDAIAQLSKCDSFPDWALPLKLKYINEENASNEAAEITHQVMKDRIISEKSYGRSSTA
ncbi:MAG: hypothetical protein KJ687_11170, partial [Proteobacteria bacterium]|nr:hypothetical protein [Pseudomonadota bacterium]